MLMSSLPCFFYKQIGSYTNYASNESLEKSPKRGDVSEMNQQKTGAATLRDIWRD